MSEIRGTYGTMYYVQDMAKTVQYYKDMLGLKPRFESPDWTEFEVNGHGLCLHGTPAGEKPFHEQGVLIIDVKGINEMVKDLKAKGVEFLDNEPKEVHPGCYSTGFRDPNGNLLSLYEDTNR
jgi:catechol 2,3-dioxygenase-like lactoylglutathione lyase family enzyme